MIALPDVIKKKKFLVTDDYESMRLMIADNLKKLGVENIRFAKSGNEAYKIIKECAGTDKQVEFLLTDLMMDDGSGLDLVKMVRSDAAVKSILPILMITSKAEVSMVLECVKAGVNNYVVKPWELEDLAKKIIDTDAKIKK